MILLTQGTDIIVTNDDFFTLDIRLSRALHAFSDDEHTQSLASNGQPQASDGCFCATACFGSLPPGDLNSSALMCLRWFG
jgi:hypothetical protein